MSLIVAVDLDGTLCDVTHRKHILDEGGSDRWERYAMACHGDRVVHGVAELLEFITVAGGLVYLVSGRSEKARERTIDWLDVHGIAFADLFLRPEGDYRGNVDLKREQLARIMGEVDAIELVIDDHEGVIDMAWREFHIPGIHVVGKPPYGYQKEHL